MARETKTVQCYPDDNIINERVRQYEAFGWELINNQRCQEYDGQTSSSNFLDGSTTVTRHFSTFNKLTFSREKTSPWYNDVVGLEKQYEDMMNKKPRDYSIDPSKILIYLGICAMIVGFGVLAMFMGVGALVAIGIVIMAIGVLLIVIYIVKKKKYKASHSNYLYKLREWQNKTEVEAKKIMRKSEQIINGN